MRYQNFSNSPSHDHHCHHFSNLVKTHNAYRKISTDEALYGSDEFRMYTFKIKKCSRTKPHDWTSCPFAHRGEKAQRRDPRRFLYSGIGCPAYRAGMCRRGDSCQFAHGIFEYWLHPTRYRTRSCTSGLLCDRKVCFFAHSLEQMRFTEARLHSKFCRFAVGPRMLNQCGGGYFEEAEAAMQYPDAASARSEKALPRQNYGDVDYFPDLGWVSELINS